MEPSVDELLERICERKPPESLRGLVRLIVEQQAVTFMIGEGAVVLDEAANADLELEMSAAELEQSLDTPGFLTQRYIRGDLKPVGSSGALLGFLSLFEGQSAAAF